MFGIEILGPIRQALYGHSTPIFLIVQAFLTIPTIVVRFINVIYSVGYSGITSGNTSAFTMPQSLHM